MNKKTILISIIGLFLLLFMLLYGIETPAWKYFVNEILMPIPKFLPLLIVLAITVAAALLLGKKLWPSVKEETT